MTNKWLKAGAAAIALVTLVIVALCVRYPLHELPLKSSPLQFSEYRKREVGRVVNLVIKGSF